MLQLAMLQFSHMPKHDSLSSLVEQAYLNSQQSFASWMWQNHVPVVARFAQQLSQKYIADPDLAIAGALLHDFGDVFVNRHSPNHAQVSRVEATKVLLTAQYTDAQILTVLNQIIAPHSCKDGHLPTIIEGKVLATADALAHLNTDFYLQFAWMHLPENLEFQDYKQWVQQKLQRDFTQKIFFEDERVQVQAQYQALSAVFA